MTIVHFALPTGGDFVRAFAGMTSTLGLTGVVRIVFAHDDECPAASTGRSSSCTCELVEVTFDTDDPAVLARVDECCV